MRITSILPVIPEKLFRVVYDDNDENILETLQDQWTDTQWLRDFFIEYKKDLEALAEPFSLRGAVKQVINDADDLFGKLHENDGDKLNDFFKPLDNREKEVYDNQFQKGRIERPKTWLRLYAIQYDGKYIITGGAIKLTEKMNRPHLKTELKKLEILQKKLELDIEKGTLGYLDL